MSKNMDANHKKYWLDLFLLCALLLTVGAALVGLLLPHHHHLIKKTATFLTFNRRQWFEIHGFFGIIFFVLALIHIITRGKELLALTKEKLGLNKK